jgi:hypothetical protein
MIRILRGLSSRLLACGCLAGIYEQYDGAVIVIVDSRRASCPNAAHSPGHVIPVTDVLDSQTSDSGR